MPDAASSGTIAAEPRFAHLETGVDAARAALAMRDLPDALAVFAALRVAFPSAPDPFLLPAAALTDRYCLDEADLLLEVAAERFPEDPAVAAAFARAALHRGDVPAALRRWAEARRRFPDDCGIGVGSAEAMREAKQFGAAEAMLRTIQDRFTTEPAPLAERARLAGTRGDHAAAVALWRALRDQYPDVVTTYIGEAEALRAAQRSDEAETLLTLTIDRFPAEAGPLIAHAELAASCRDWPAASRRWEAVRDRHPSRVEGAVGQAAVWRNLRQFDAADAVLSEAMRRFPDNVDVLAAFAAVANDKRDWAAAIDRWADARSRIPGCARLFVASIATLRAAGGLGEAETLAVEAQRRFPANPAPALESASLAEARGDRMLAASRWEKLRAQFPDAIEAWSGLERCLRGQDRSAEADAVQHGARIRFPWLAMPVGENTEPLALPAAVAQTGPIRVAVTGFHLAHQISLLFSRMTPFRGRLAVQWINPGMHIDTIRTRLPGGWLGGAGVYFEETMVGDATTKRALRALLPEGCAIRTFPTSSLQALWPFQGRDERLVPEPPIYNGGRYFESDAVAAALANPAITDDALFDLYMEITEALPLDLDALFAADLARLRAEDQGSDVKLAGFVEAHFQEQMLFAAPHEHATPIVKEVARQLLETPELRSICDLDTALAGLDRLTLGWQAQGRALPIHPRVARHFGLTWWSPDRTYDFGHNSFTFPEYVLRYMRWSPWLV